MRKNTMFISAAITAFVLAMLAGVVSAYNGISSSKLLSSSTAQPVALSIAITPTASVVNVQDAETIASQYINRTDLYSIEMTNLSGAQAYKVTFSSGDIVYVGLEGQVLKATPPPAPITIYANGGGGGGNTAPPPPAENHGGDDHNDGGGGDD